jgi:hypothetical protein
MASTMPSLFPRVSDDAVVLPTSSDDAKQELDLDVPASEDGCHGVVLILFRLVLILIWLHVLP